LTQRQRPLSTCWKSVLCAKVGRRPLLATP